MCFKRLDVLFMTAGWFLILGVRGKKEALSRAVFLMQTSPHVNKPFWPSVVWGKSRRMTRLLPLSNHSLLPAGYLSGAAAVFAILSDQKNKTYFGCSAHWKSVSKGDSLAGYDIWTHSLPTAGLIQWKCVLAMSQDVSLCGPDLILRRTVRDGCWLLELQEGSRKNDTAATVSHFVDAGRSYFPLWNSGAVTWVGKCRENWISPQQWCLLWEMSHSRIIILWPRLLLVQIHCLLSKGVCSSRPQSLSDIFDI